MIPTIPIHVRKELEKQTNIIIRCYRGDGGFQGKGLDIPTDLLKEINQTSGEEAKSSMGCCGVAEGGINSASELVFVNGCCWAFYYIFSLNANKSLLIFSVPITHIKNFLKRSCYGIVAFPFSMLIRSQPIVTLGI